MQNTDVLAADRLMVKRLTHNKKPERRQSRHYLCQAGSDLQPNEAKTTECDVYYNSRHLHMSLRTH